jgi:hypothetical protein
MRRVLILATAVLAVNAMASPASAQLTLNESGFISAQLAGDFSKQIELGVGPDSCLYYGSFDGLTRLCPNGLITTVCDSTLQFPVGLAFSSGGSFGSFLYSADNSIGEIRRAAGCTASTTFAPLPNAGALAFPPSGSAYGNFLYACAAFSGPIYRVSPTGVLTSWSTLATAYLKFGPGGVWGNGMFATQYGAATGSGIVKVSSTGVTTTVTSGLLVPEGFDWGFDGDMFATDMSAGVIYRVKSTGVRTVFATLAGAADIAYRPSDGGLYVVSNQGGLYRIRKGSTTDVTLGTVADAAPVVAPNPANGACALRFVQHAAGITRVSVLDAQGRLVRHLPETWRLAGANVAAWDGRDEQGNAVRAGAYFMRLTVGGQSRTTRVTITH